MSLIDWQGYSFDDGSLRRASRHIGQLRLHPAGGGWRQQAPECLEMGDEITHVWRHAASGVRLEIRMSFEADRWVWRAVFANLSSRLACVPGLLLSWQPDYPHPIWLGGRRGLIVLDEDFGDGQVLAAEQQRGNSSVGTDATKWLSKPTIGLDAGQTQVVSWVVRVFPCLRVVAERQPAWFPSAWAVGSKEAIEIGSQDIAVDAGPPDPVAPVQGLSIRSTPQGSGIVAEAGRQRIRMHEASGTTTVDLAWGRPLRVVLGARAGELLASQDARTCSPAAALIVSRAISLHQVRADEAEIFVMSALDEQARCGSIEPCTVLALVDQAERDVEWLTAALDAAGRLRPGVGAHLAWLRAGVSATASGRRVPPMPRLDAAIGSVEVVLQRAERGLTQRRPSSEPDADIWAALALLGSQLPGEVTEPRLTAAAVALAAWVPEHWDVEQRWLHNLAVSQTQTTLRLLAGVPDDQTLAWLAW